MILKSAWIASLEGMADEPKSPDPGNSVLSHCRRYKNVIPQN
jgi:hypothetical protein